MKQEKIFDLIKEQGFELIQSDETSLVLLVEGDENDADYINDTHNFEFSELAKASRIADKIAGLPSHFEDDSEIDIWEDDEDGDCLGDYIPSGQQDLVHSISRVQLEITINGVKYNLI